MDKKFLQNLPLKLGKRKSVLIFTAVSIIGSITIAMTTVFFLLKLGVAVSPKVALLLSTGIPLIITPFLGSQIIELLIKIKKLEIEMRHLATYDSLSGLLTRHAFMNRAKHSIEVAKRGKQPFAMLMLDIDHFKKINDKYGHQAGDKVLESLGNSVRKIARKSDLAGRLGGEEFAFFLPNTPVENAKFFSERLLQEINQSIIKHNNNQIQYTASIGIISSPNAEIDDIDELYHLADKTLYKAKSSGRNQIQIHTPQPELEFISDN